jgi:hypothetical protein
MAQSQKTGVLPMRTVRRPSSLIVAAGLLLAAVTVTATKDQQTPPAPPGADTRDRYLNPRETDISLGLKVDPKDVPDVPPVEPDKALETFRIKKGFRLELVAHEPAVIDPIQIFADRLRYPSAVFPYDSGVYVGLEPDIIYLKDKNGDGVADFRQVVFTGFGNQRDRLDSQTFMDSLTWGLDNRIHGGKGHGGTITSVASPNEAPLDLRGRDFSFDPRFVCIPLSRSNQGGVRCERQFAGFLAHDQTESAVLEPAFFTVHQRTRRERPALFRRWLPRIR